MNVKAATAEDPETVEDLDTADAADADPEQEEGAAEEADGEGSDPDAEIPVGEAEEVIVTIGDTDPEAGTTEEDLSKAPTWVRDLRKSHRETSKRLRELEAENAKLKGGPPAQNKVAELGPEPSLEGCNYDQDEFKKEYVAWTSRRLQIEQQQREREKQAEAERAAWDATVAKHNERKAALKVRDYEDAEEVVDSLFNPTQQGVLLHVAENSAVLKYALGRNPQKARELAKITDLPKFIAELVRVETQVKTMPKPKTAPQPERVIRGSGPLATTSDKQLERLRAEADKTGDRSKVVAYLRQKQTA